MWPQGRGCEKLSTFELDPQFRTEAERETRSPTGFRIFICLCILTLSINAIQPRKLIVGGQGSADYIMGARGRAEKGEGGGRPPGGGETGRARMNCRPVAKTFFFFSPAASAAAAAFAAALL